MSNFKTLTRTASLIIILSFLSTSVVYPAPDTTLRVPMAFGKEQKNSFDQRVNEVTGGTKTPKYDTIVRRTKLGSNSSLKMIAPLLFITSLAPLVDIMGQQQQAQIVAPQVSDFSPRIAELMEKARDKNEDTSYAAFCELKWIALWQDNAQALNAFVNVAPQSHRQLNELDLFLLDALNNIRDPKPHVREALSTIDPPKALVDLAKVDPAARHILQMLRDNFDNPKAQKALKEVQRTTDKPENRLQDTTWVTHTADDSSQQQKTTFSPRIAQLMEKTRDKDENISDAAFKELMWAAMQQDNTRHEDDVRNTQALDALVNGAIQNPKGLGVLIDLIKNIAVRIEDAQSRGESVVRGHTQLIEALRTLEPSKAFVDLAKVSPVAYDILRQLASDFDNPKARKALRTLDESENKLESPIHRHGPMAGEDYDKSIGEILNPQLRTGL